MSKISSRVEVREAKLARASAIRGWLQDRLGMAQKRAAVARMVPKRQGGSGVTLEMKEISRAAARREPEYVVLHTAPNRAMRRQEIRRGGESLPGSNTPYMAPTDGHQVALRQMGRVRGGRRSS